MSTKITAPCPRPNQMSESGKRAIDGSGLNIAVRVSKRSEPIRLALANALKTAASSNPAAYPFKSSLVVYHVTSGNFPERMDAIMAVTVSEKDGNSSGLFRDLA